YKYTVTEYGFPFSNELQHAIDFLLNRGFIYSDESGLFHPNDDIISAELNNFSHDKSLVNRRELISTALQCGININFSFTKTNLPKKKKKNYIFIFLFINTP
ncbi:hypothetical protein J9A51_27300, partial [Klebsiella pneumoniae]